MSPPQQDGSQDCWCQSFFYRCSTAASITLTVVGKIRTRLNPELERRGSRSVRSRLPASPRPGTLVALRRDWVKFEARALLIPKTKMKSGRKFDLPLSTHMVGIIKQALAIGDVLSSCSLPPTPASCWKEVGSP
jgi:hypothetical protein